MLWDIRQNTHEPERSEIFILLSVSGEDGYNCGAMVSTLPQCRIGPVFYHHACFWSAQTASLTFTRRFHRHWAESCS